jgi:hypothetical protein
MISRRVGLGEGDEVIVRYRPHVKHNIVWFEVRVNDLAAMHVCDTPKGV